jgi:GTP cyclohydrolase II
MGRSRKNNATMTPRPLKLQDTSPGLDAPSELAAVRVDRAQTELRHGRAVAVVSTDPAAPVLLAAAVETLGATRLQMLSHAGAPPRLLLTPERLRAMGWTQAPGPCSMVLSAPLVVERLQRLAAVLPGSVPAVEWTDFANARPASAAMLAALALAKRARLVPALLVIELPATALPALAQAEVLRVSEGDVAALAHAALDAEPTLRRVSDAHVPVAASEDCTLVLFREIHGEAEHVAIIVGQPDLSQPVPVRLHSSCLTGDLLGSLRCDCGDQLRSSVERLAGSGGVLLYLAQEGRGTGLANKLRAYRLQDAGLDTIDADHYLGFSGDERDFAPAVAMLQELGITRIHLLTNNPHKIDSMRRGGLEVVERVAVSAPVNPHNARYVQTKQERAGHLLNGAGES